MTFGSPWLLLLLAAVPVVAIAYRMLERRREARVRVWARPDMEPNVVRNPLRRWRVLPAILFLVGLSLLVVGVARPERVLPASESGAPTVALVFDLSSSMSATDVRPNREAMARKIALSFVRELPAGDRIAIVNFGNTPTVAVAPTLERSVVYANLPTTALKRDGTAIGDAINEAVSLAAGSGRSGQVNAHTYPGAVLLFSDGGQNAGGTTPEEAVISALVDYVPVDTVAVGTLNGQITQISRAPGYPVPVQIAVPVIAHTLRTLASSTGGHFFEGSAVEKSPRTLSPVWQGLRPYELPGRHVADLSALLAAASLVLVAAAAGVSGLLFGRVP